MTEIFITEAARKIIAADVTAHTKAMIRHAEYVRETGIGLDEVADHVALFRDAYRGWATDNLEAAEAALAEAITKHDEKATKPRAKAVEKAEAAHAEAVEKASGPAVKAYATKVRNGLNRALNKPKKDAAPADVLAAFVTAFERAEEAGFTRAEILALVSEPVETDDDANAVGYDAIPV